MLHTEGTEGYSVYSLTDGAVYDEETYDDIETALEMYEALVGKILIERKIALGGDWTDTTVHLYEPFTGNMLEETLIGQES